MKQLPIIMTTESVLAILDGRKTMTRRVIKPQLINPNPEIEGLYFDAYNKTNLWEWWGKDNRIYGTKEHSRKCPYGAPGDLLWVKETWASMCKEADPFCWHEDDDFGAHCIEYHYIEYKADNPNNKYPGRWDDATKEEIEMGKIEGWLPRWKSPRFMPKKYARLWLEVKDVRVERVQEISYEDIGKEGIHDLGVIPLNTAMLITGAKTEKELKEKLFNAAFASLWDSINKKRGYPWESNPWTWVIEFEITERPTI